MRKLALALASVAPLAAPPAAHGDATIVSRDVALHGARTLAAARGHPRFTLVGLHWRGAGSVAFRTRSLASGRWSGWRAAAPEPEDRPDAGTHEARRPGWRIGNPFWTGPSDRIEYRLHGHVAQLRAHFVWSSADGVPPRALSLAGAPPLTSRGAWGADEAIRRAPPLYAPSLRFALVHHTAGSNGYSAAESAAVVRAIQLYHVRGNGWNDIGYNFLVDRFGRVFEGRFGGVERNVVGAHAEGFNTGSVGVAVLGTYGSSTISARARASLAALLAWRLDVAHVDPLSDLSVASGGNGRFPNGAHVFLRAVSGHRDTGFTSCPGNALYATLDALAASVSAIGLPKLYAPSVRGAPGGLVRFSARLSAPIPWTVTVTDPAGVPVASGAGTGTAVDWTWDATTVTGSGYSYAIAAPNVRGVSGRIGGRAAVLTLTAVRATPAAVTPNGDGQDDAATVSYTLGAPATVTARLLDAAGAELATLFSGSRAAGRHSFSFTADGVSDGVYTIALVAASNGRQVGAQVGVLVNRVLSGLSLAPSTFSPNGDGRRDELRLAFTLLGPAIVKLRVLRGSSWVATPFTGPLPAGAQTLAWDGSKPHGRPLDGRYRAELTVEDAVGRLSHELAFTVDTRPPTIRLVARRPLRLWVGEPAEIVLTSGRRRLVVERLRAGAFRVPLAPRRLRAVAWDAAGNRGRPLRLP